MISLPWYIAGPLIGLMVPLILIVREKQLGVSSSFRVLGSYVFPKLSYFKYDKLKDFWQVEFSLGILISALALLSLNQTGEIGTESDVLYAVQASTIYTPSNWLIFLVGGLAIGFGARYANGCTAGHCIMGNSLFAVSSLVTTISFFVGGLIVSHFVLPLIPVL